MDRVPGSALSAIESRVAAVHALPAPEPGDRRDPGAEALDDLSEKLAAFNVLRKSDQAAADEILEQLGGHGKVEEDIVRELWRSVFGEKGEERPGKA